MSTLPKLFRPVTLNAHIFYLALSWLLELFVYWKTPKWVLWQTVYYWQTVKTQIALGVITFGAIALGLSSGSTLLAETKTILREIQF